MSKSAFASIRATALAVVAALSACQPRPPAHAQSPATRATQPALAKFDYVQPKMGTVFHIVLYAPEKAVADKAATAAFARVDDLNRALSDYDPNSELSRLAHQTDDGPMTRPTQVGNDLWTVLERGVTAARLSEGAFDVTIGPYVHLWRRSRSQKELPSPERLADAKASVGYQHLELDPATRSVRLTAPKMRLDVGGIAKGYAAEQAMAELRKFGIDRAVVGAAGDIAVGEPPPGRPGWRVAIQSLQKPDESVGYLLLKRCGVSTSGDTYRFVEIDGVRYSHILDPRTGLGLTRRTGVTVVAPDAFTTDWVSTAVSILGPEEGRALVEQIPDAAVRIVTLNGEEAAIFESERFKSLKAGRPETFPASEDWIE